ncbi:alpha/beta hydrolase [Aliiglaciecola sp. LCG003]|uniref:alpha/beta hydrolase family protein n=1 Tax=Aliiglaciecola sp. LCG003 TaxID=3053655 RepID=UPI0025724032|nr:alpha/beta hydrolase [Aliiglaciecola sp. LCG003]WJG10317.1 alpha/beta hydrolase [Aliiglaciecola sp. LCG003]
MLNLYHFLASIFFVVSAGLCAQPSKLPLTNVSYKSILELPYEDADLTLAYGNDKYQYGKLWRPLNTSDNEASPLVIFVHGGCWLNAYGIDHSFALTSALAKQGYLVWSLEYRRAGDEGGNWPGAFLDVQAGIDFILNQTQEPFDPQQVFVVGHSAGGHLATLAADKRNGSIHAIGLAAITDVAKYGAGENSCQQAVPKFMGGSFAQMPAAYDLATAKSFTHSVLLHGSADSIVPLSQSIQPTGRSVIIPDAGHFDFLHPQSTAFDTLVTTLNAQSSQLETQKYDR